MVVKVTRLVGKVTRLVVNVSRLVGKVTRLVSKVSRLVKWFSIKLSTKIENRFIAKCSRPMTRFCKLF